LRDDILDWPRGPSPEYHISANSHTQRKIDNQQSAIDNSPDRPELRTHRLAIMTLNGSRCL
jgi:hypothetical protein